MMGHRSRVVLPLAVLAVVIVGGIVPLAQRRPATPPSLPGALGGGVTLLPNGWRIAPVGRHVQAGDLPLGLVSSPDGRFVMITNNGYAAPSLTVVDTRSLYVPSRVPLDHSWLGLAWHPDGTRLFASGAAQNTVHELSWKDGRLSSKSTLALGWPQRSVGTDALENAGFVGGLAVRPDGKRLYAVQVFGQALTMVDLELGRVARTVALEAEPYTCVVSPDGRTLFVSLWGGSKVLLFDAETLAETGRVDVGEHPSALVLSRDGRRLFVACANTNAVWAVDVESRRANEQISVALYPDSPPGATPNALAVSPDGRTLLVANADNNTVAMVDIATPGASVVNGFVPTGWYPTGVLFDPDGTRFFVLSGKGLASAANPRGPSPGNNGAPGQYIAGMLQGAFSVVPVPSAATLKAWTARVYELTPYVGARRLAPADPPVASPIPRRVGDPSPIKHVFYVIRENRSYDQILGDVAEGNGDPGLTLFGGDVTPNAHALVRQFGLFDNFYVDAEVSADGHAFSMGGYTTDVVRKLWPTSYGGRGGPYLSEGGWRLRTPFGNFAAPPQGYLWDHAARAGVTVRSYGEFVAYAADRRTVRASVPGLEGRFHPSFPPFDMDVRDVDRFAIWLEEFRRFEATGDLPQLSIIRLPNDHTVGAAAGQRTPVAMVADNDLALGQLVEVISRSRFWKESAIFIVEDDAQNGPDHVDAHRSVLIVASPFARRGAVDSSLYSTGSVLRTMELVLGIPPMSQYDAAARPLYAAFQATPENAPFTHLDARVPLDTVNDWNTPAARASARLDFREADLAPDDELNAIIWAVMRGATKAMPPPRRTAFVRPVEANDGDDER